MNTKKVFQLAVIFTLFVLGAGTLNAEVTYAIPLKGQEHQIGSLLNWTTANEFNSQIFIVERSVDGADYEIIGEVEAAGNSDNQNGYRFLDVGVNHEKSYYRLRQVDQDGTASFSQTIMIKKELANNFMILAMSNTVTNNTFTVSLDATIDDEIHYAVKNKKGETIFQANQDLEFGINEITINVEDEVEGTYFIDFRVEKEVEQLVIRKVDDEIKKKENVASKKQSNGG